MKHQIVLRIAAVLMFAALGLGGIVQAQSPREQLQQMVEQLQKTPNDNALRERIIKLGAEIKPAPAILEGARRPFIRGNTAIKDATTPEDYAAAIKLYEEALQIAPWWADAYFNLAKGQEMHQDFDDAIQTLKFFLQTSPPPADARDAQDHIYALEEKHAKKTSAERTKAEAAKAKANLPQALVQQLQSKYGNRRLKSQLGCWIRDGRQVLTCNETEANGTTTWTPGARDGSYTWMPIQTNAGSLDFTSLNIRYVFRLDTGNPNRIVMGSAVNGRDHNLYCGLLKGAEAKDIEWKICDNGQPVDLRFGATSADRPMFDTIMNCDAARNCTRHRWVLE